MAEEDSGAGRMLAGLLSVIGITALDDIPNTVAAHATSAGFTDVHIYLGDVERRSLHLLAGPGASASVERELPIQATLPGRAYQYGMVLPDQAPSAKGFQYWVPMFNGVERLGVLSVTSEYDGDTVRENARSLAALVALAIANKRGHSDTYARVNRTRPMNVAAEAQWHLIPPRSYADARVSICATLEPSYQISGDAYDYALAGPLVYLSIFDAMGHDTAAGQTAGLAVAASRSARRGGHDLAETGDAIERELARPSDDIRYATAVLAVLDTRSGLLTWSSFGHPPPLVLRGKEGISLSCPPALPLGTGLGDLGTTICRQQLEPGDRVALYTDGITEARRPGARQFGLKRLISVLTRHHADRLTVSETVRRFVHAFLDYHDGNLKDDATVLLCEWPGPSPD